MPLSIVISHFAPSAYYRNVLIATITSIRKQRYFSNAEIIVTDDGSPWSESIGSKDINLSAFSRDAIRREPKLRDLDIDLFIVRRRDGCYSKALLWNLAVSKAKYDKFVFLDDDHYLLSRSALANFERLLSGYPFVIGRIIQPDGSTRLFDSLKVQGTNFGMTRDLLTEMGGFGEYTMRWGRGEDSDIFWKAYLALRPNRSQRMGAAYASHIVTFDFCSGRWTTAHGDNDTFITEFTALHGVHPHYNPSRIKRDWVEYATPRCFVHDRVLYLLAGIEQNSKILRTWLRNIRRTGASLSFKATTSPNSLENCVYRILSLAL